MYTFIFYKKQFINLIHIGMYIINLHRHFGYIDIYMVPLLYKCIGK